MVKKSGLKKRIQVLFIQDIFYLGGIEVLELKLVERLSSLGIDLAIAARPNDILDAPGAVNERIIHEGYPDLLARANRLVSQGVDKVILVSLHPTAAIASELLGRMIEREHGQELSIHHFHWVSHSRAFFFSGSVVVKRLFRQFFFLLPEKSVYFMNDAALKAHQEFWRTPLEHYPVLRIIGREPTIAYLGEAEGENVELKCSRRKLRIVSVGRLVKFKSYNTHAAAVVRQLRDSGIDATWDIWGYGPDEAAIVSMSEKLGVSEHVRLRGSLPHDLFDETVASFDVFVGMGTAVLEAARTGMPVCVGVENGGDASYGHLHVAPTDSVGDRVEGFPERKLVEVLREFAELGMKERARIGRLDAMAAQQRGSTLDDFVAAILAAEPIRDIGLAGKTLLPLGKAYLRAVHWKREARRS